MSNHQHCYSYDSKTKQFTQNKDSVYIDIENGVNYELQNEEIQEKILRAEVDNALKYLYNLEHHTAAGQKATLFPSTLPPHTSSTQTPITSSTTVRLETISQSKDSSIATTNDSDELLSISTVFVLFPPHF